MKKTKILNNMIVRCGKDNLLIRRVEVNTRDNHRAIKYFVKVLK